MRSIIRALVCVCVLWPKKSAEEGGREVLVFVGLGPPGRVDVVENLVIVAQCPSRQEAALGWCG